MPYLLIDYFAFKTELHNATRNTGKKDIKYKKLIFLQIFVAQTLTKI